MTYPGTMIPLESLSAQELTKRSSLQMLTVLSMILCVLNCLKKMVSYDSPREIMMYLAQTGSRLSYLDIAANAGEQILRDQLFSYIDPAQSVDIRRFVEVCL